MSDASLTNPAMPETPQTYLSPRMHHIGSRRAPFTGKVDGTNPQRSLPSIVGKHSSISPPSANPDHIRTENSIDD
jgi:hypothetical protein